MTIELKQKLVDYFEKRFEVSLAFLFGSHASGRERPSSDFDIGIYFKSQPKIELESKNEYPSESEIRSDLDRILKTEVDLIILNRARPSLVFQVLNTGIPLIIKDQALYLKLLSKTHYEAVDFWSFVNSFWKIRKQAASLTPEARAILIEHLTFLENEWADFSKFQVITQTEYMNNRDSRRNLERWIENLVMNALDIAKIILASDRKAVPQTYRETLRMFANSYLEVGLTELFSDLAEMRNIVAHEYLDLKWEKMQKFIRQAEKLYPVFMERVRKILD